ncbi:MAG: Trk system potassium transporter TrkA [Planctomycetes bacterium]|nr:Trk system potassium transporter TrkA [Planctomycetota bacterium]
MNILIVGLGEVGTYLANMLSNDGHSVTVVDPNPQRVGRCSDVLDVKSVTGDGSRPDILERADAGDADLLLAVSNDDNVNMLTCLFGKRMGAKKTVLRVKDMTPFRGFQTFFRKNLLFDLILSVDEIAAEEIVKHLRQHEGVGVEAFADGRVQMRRLRMPDESVFLATPLRSLKLPPGMLLAALQRGNDVEIPGGDHVLQAGDEVFVIGEPRAVATFERKAGVKTSPLRNVVLSGSSGIAHLVQRSLQRLGAKTRILVEDREEAHELAGQLEGVTVLHGSGTDLGLLREEHIGEADAFVGLSDRDEENLMSCQLARSLRVPRTIALVQKPDYVTIYQALGIDVAVSPRLLCANRILSFVRSGSMSTVTTIGEGQVEIFELELKAGCRLVGKTLAEAAFPKGSLVCAIARDDGEVVVPRGEDQLHALDNLVVVARHEVVPEVLAHCGMESER